jgi:hypothetical protein
VRQSDRRTRVAVRCRAQLQRNHKGNEFRNASHGQIVVSGNSSLHPAELSDLLPRCGLRRDPNRLVYFMQAGRLYRVPRPFSCADARTCTFPNLSAAEVAEAAFGTCEPDAELPDARLSGWPA